uniref:Uncharacterized protein n=1 Tax=Anguilla anguilla TaxID=7936 RepID=A0A0E9PXJ6_ANGAN
MLITHASHKKKQTEENLLLVNCLQFEAHVVCIKNRSVGQTLRIGGISFLLGRKI